MVLDHCDQLKFRVQYHTWLFYNPPFTLPSYPSSTNPRASHARLSKYPYFIK